MRSILEGHVTDTVQLPARQESCREPLDVLRTEFGHASFRPGQGEVIAAVMQRRDALAIMPTGAGKSVTFQVPSLCGAGPVLVVSPLVALMRDQVEGACRRGFRATWVDSTLDRGERRARFEALSAGGIDLLYVSPEGLPGSIPDLAGSIGLMAVDEAHCISQWGHDFRPSYRTLGDARRRLGGVPLLAVTATATLRVEEDIVASLGMSSPFRFRGSCFRPNLRLAVRAKDAACDSRDEVLAACRSHEGQAGIVYCLSRRDAGGLASYLRSRGIRAAPYHAGMEADARDEVQAAYASGEVSVVVATVAFGMGIDKADVRYVVHADLPGSIEAYAQEIGRAGRDGRDSDCLLLYSWADVRRRAMLVRALPPGRRVVVRSALGEMFRFAAASGCRHARLCSHFGERIERCRGACDECGGPSAGEMTAVRRCVGGR